MAPTLRPTVQPRLVALQGFAPGFHLTPIAIAVQGLIALLQEELADYVGGGRRKGGAVRPSGDRRRDLGPSVEHVRALWELHDLRRQDGAEKAEPAPGRAASSAEAPGDTAAAPGPGSQPDAAPPLELLPVPLALTGQAAQLQDASAQAAANEDDEEAIALALLLLVRA